MKKTILFLMGLALMFASTAQKNKKPTAKGTIKKPSAIKPITAAPAAITKASYTINIKAAGYTGGLIYLAYYYGNALNVQDSGYLSPSGSITFSRNEDLLGGIYVLYLPDKQRIDFLYDGEPNMTITTDKTDVVSKTNITGSAENTEYLHYQNYVGSRGMAREQARKNYEASKNKADSTKYEADFIRLNKEMNDYRLNVIATRPKSLLAALFSAMTEAKYLDIPLRTKADTMASFYHYKSHYWDGISFMDDRIIRTPFFIPKLTKYYGDVEANVDSIKRDVDYRLLLARNSPKLYQYLLNWYTDYFINPKYMGHDAIFVHLFNKYHSTGVSNWLNEKQQKSISDRAYMLMSNLVGEQAAPLDFMSSNEKLAPLYNQPAKYTLVVFWDPNCGHCKTEVPRVDSFYKAMWKQVGLKVYAVLTPENKIGVIDEWKNFISDKNLTEWTHVYHTPEMVKLEESKKEPNFRQLYDVTSTPTMYLLDKDKRIIAKKLTLEQFSELIRLKEKNIN